MVIPCRWVEVSSKVHSLVVQNMRLATIRCIHTSRMAVEPDMWVDDVEFKTHFGMDEAMDFINQLYDVRRHIS